MKRIQHFSTLFGANLGFLFLSAKESQKKGGDGSEKSIAALPNRTTILVDKHPRFLFISGFLCRQSGPRLPGSHISASCWLCQPCKPLCRRTGQDSTCRS